MDKFSATENNFTTTLRGTVEKVIRSMVPSQPDIVQIALERAHDLYREIRIVSKLKNIHGKEVQLELGAQVEIIVTTQGADHPTSRISS